MSSQIDQVHKDAPEETAMTLTLRATAVALSLGFSGALVSTSGASAQAPTTASSPGDAALVGAPAPERIQPWGLPPPPSGIGPVSLFADIHDAPQGKFLEGGAFDDAGNFWFVAIGSG
jgi:gluconolactonase